MIPTAHAKEQVARFLRLFVVTFLGTLASGAALAKGIPTGRDAIVGLVVGAVVSAAETTWRQIKPALPVAAQRLVTQAGTALESTGGSTRIVGLLERIASTLEGSAVAGEVLSVASAPATPPVVVHVHNTPAPVDPQPADTAATTAQPESTLILPSAVGQPSPAAQQAAINLASQAQAGQTAPLMGTQVAQPPAPAAPAPAAAAPAGP